MIRNLNIENFQSHKKTILNFDPGVNIIVGSTNSGKSAIIRALRWIIENKPLGDSFRSIWGGTTKASIQLDSEIVSRTKSNSANFYSLKNKEEPEIEFHAIKTDVPSEIEKILNIQEINTQFQMDPPFLLSKSAGEVNSHFSKVANIDIINISQSKIRKWLKDVEKEYEIQLAFIDKTQNQLREYDFLPVLEAELGTLENLESQVQISENQINELSELIEDFKNIEISIEDKTKNIIIEKEIDSILKSYTKKNDTERQIQSITNFITQTTQLETLIKNKEKKIETENIVSFLLKLYQDFKGVEKEQNDLYQLIQSYGKISTKIEILHKKLIQEEENFNFVFPNICPLCNNVVKKQKKNE